MVRIKLDRLIKEAGVQRIRFADFRPTYANLLFQSGMDLLSIQRYLRHRSLKTIVPFIHHEEKDFLERQEK